VPADKGGEGIPVLPAAAYADHHRTKVMTVPAEEFLRRLLLHVLPKGFVRIRHFGLLASVNVATKLRRCRQLLGQETPSDPPPSKWWIDRVYRPRPPTLSAVSRLPRTAN
jgi:hypothetical protein